MVNVNEDEDEVEASGGSKWWKQEVLKSQAKYQTVTMYLFSRCQKIKMSNSEAFKMIMYALLG